MNTFGRRSFLKGLLGTAAALGLPVEVIEQVTKSIEYLPDTEITPAEPTCYIVIDNQKVPVGHIEITEEMGEINTIYTPDSKHPGKFIASSYERNTPSLWYVSFSTDENYFSSLSNKLVKFEVISEEIPFKIKGEGHLMIYYTCPSLTNLTNNESEFAYNYDITGTVENF